jgi:hypothetical protein
MTMVVHDSWSTRPSDEIGVVALAYMLDKVGFTLEDTTMFCASEDTHV